MRLDLSLTKIGMETEKERDRGGRRRGKEAQDTPAGGVVIDAMWETGETRAERERKSRKIKGWFSSSC